MSNDTVTMNEDTDYVHTHIVNYEPTYLVLANCVLAWEDDQHGPLAPYRDILRSEVEANFVAMGLHPRDLTDDVDYAAIIEWELENS
jgi:hypothetical protein